MASRIDQVVAALESVLDDSLNSTRVDWPVSSVNRWIKQLPKDAVENAEDLVLDGDGSGNADMEILQAHVAAVIKFLTASKGDVAEDDEEGE